MLSVEAVSAEPLSNFIDIKQLLSIRIKLWWIRLDQHTEPTLWLHWLIESFQELAKHRVEEVTFEIFYNSDWTAYTAEWAALDVVLGQMRSLTKVHVKLDAYDDVKGRWKYPREYSVTATKDVERILLLSARGRSWPVSLRLILLADWLSFFLLCYRT